MDSLLIRKLKIEDADDVSKIFAVITKTTVSIDYTRAIEGQVRKEEDASFVAELEGKVVGFMICNIVSASFGLLEKSAWIAMLGVDPKLMGQGIGNRLAKEIFKVCMEKGIKNVYTSVKWDSTDVLSFFKTLGFERSSFINLERTLE